jgi:hypothetical protein
VSVMSQEITTAAAAAPSASSGPTMATAVLLTGTSYSTRDQIKAIGGGVWVKAWNALAFPEDKIAAVEAFVKAQPSVPLSASKSAPAAGAPAASASKKADAASSASPAAKVSAATHTKHCISSVRMCF